MSQKKMCCFFSLFTPPPLVFKRFQRPPSGMDGVYEPAAQGKEKREGRIPKQQTMTKCVCLCVCLYVYVCICASVHLYVCCLLQFIYFSILLSILIGHTRSTLLYSLAQSTTGLMMISESTFDDFFSSRYCSKVCFCWFVFVCMLAQIPSHLLN